MRKICFDSKSFWPQTDAAALCATCLSNPKRSDHSRAQQESLSADPRSLSNEYMSLQLSGRPLASQLWAGLIQLERRQEPSELHLSSRSCSKCIHIQIRTWTSDNSSCLSEQPVATLPCKTWQHCRKQAHFMFCFFFFFASDANYVYFSHRELIWELLPVIIIGLKK